MYELTTTALEVNELCCHGEVLMASVCNKLEKQYIYRELFVKRDQKLINMLKHTVKDWDYLRRKVKKEIYKNTKLLFINYAQEEKMIVNHLGVKRLIFNYNKIGESF